MDVEAKLNNFRMSAQKARLVADQIRGKSADQALATLQLSPKKFARPLEKLLRSALANAEEKNNRASAGIDVDNLFVSRITVDEGSSAWRIRARAQGRAAWIQKKTSHIQVVLSEE